MSELGKYVTEQVYIMMTANDDVEVPSDFAKLSDHELQIESRANKAVAINMGAKINASAILYRMDKLDGTNEFYEFLGQMEEDTNE
ncbi:hypothetical protein Q510_00011 [Staphylococcus aureus M1342]|nr:hypothetical protein Q510_00011 [Staphylococcus aureus M1342]